MKKLTAANVSRRTTLKRLGALAASSCVAGKAFAAAGTDAIAPMTAVPIIDVQTRVSAVTNDLEVVITNLGAADADIRQLTPGETSTRRGRFDFTSITDDQGRLYLAAGESVSVPLQHHTVVLDSSAVSARAHSLTDTLKRGLSVQLADGQFADLRVRGYAAFA